MFSHAVVIPVLMVSMIGESADQIAFHTFVRVVCKVVTAVDTAV